MFNLLPDVFAQRVGPYIPPRRPWYEDLFRYGGFSGILIILAIGVAIYLFIDALRHKRNFVFWPLAALFSGATIGIPAALFGLSGFYLSQLGGLVGPIAVLVFYLATKGEEGTEYKEEDFLAQGIKRAYFYIFSFITLAILFFGVADLVRVILDFNWGGGEVESFGRTFSFTRDSFSRNVSFRLATIIVALPIWFFHWLHLENNLPKVEDPHELRITFRTHKSYLYLVSGITLVVVIIFGIWFVYQLLNLLLGVSDIRLRSFAAPIGYTLSSLVTFFYHFSILRGKSFGGVEERVSALPAPSKPTEVKAATPKPSGEGEKFCPHCGTKNVPTSSFCTTCGTKLS